MRSRSTAPDCSTAEVAAASLYSILAESAGKGTRGETALTATKETLDADQEERNQWLLALGH
jgi:hypothetical protein